LAKGVLSVIAHQGESPRGSIVDRNGVLLAADRYFYEVSTTPNYFDDDEQRQQVADLLQELATSLARKP
jgi:cell division protein FtsI/penicillin-binding protein 2